MPLPHGADSLRLCLLPPFAGVRSSSCFRVELNEHLRLHLFTPNHSVTDPKGEKKTVMSCLTIPSPVSLVHGMFRLVHTWSRADVST